MFKQTITGAVLTALTLFLAFATGSRAADSPQWRGADRTAVSKEAGLLKEWPAGGPPLAWKVSDLGGGYSAPSIASGRIYGMSRRADHDVVWALSETDGKAIWATPLEASATQNMPQGQEGPGCTPTVDGDRLYVTGTGGQVTCLAVADGKVLWHRSMPGDFGGILPRWAYRESPLVDGDKVICTPGGPDATLVALDKLTGAILWKTDVPTELEGGGFANAGAGYSSPIAIDFEGQRQYVQMTAKALIGVAAADGKLLWNFRKPANSYGINCSTPIYRDGMVFATSAYNAGGGAVKLSKDASGGITATEVFFSQSLQNAHGGAVEVDGFLYLSRDPGILTCVELATGKVLWSEREPGKGSVVSADGQLYCRSEAGTGTVYLVDAKSSGYVERGHFDPPDRTRQAAWAHPVIANGKLYLRDQDTLLCYDIKAK